MDAIHLRHARHSTNRSSEIVTRRIQWMAALQHMNHESPVPIPNTGGSKRDSMRRLRPNTVLTKGLWVQNYLKFFVVKTKGFQ